MNKFHNSRKQSLAQLNSITNLKNKLYDYLYIKKRGVETFPIV